MRDKLDIVVQEMRGNAIKWGIEAKLTPVRRRGIKDKRSSA